MKSLKNYLLAVLTLAAIAGTTLAWKEYRELSDLKATAVSPEERADLQKRVWDSQRRIKELEHDLAGPASARPGAATADSDRAANRGGSGNALASTILSRMNDPEAQRLMAQQIRTQIERRYADLFKSLNLSPEKLEQFKSLLVDRQTAAMDVFSAANEQGITDPQDFQKLVESTQADIDNQIKAAIGDPAYGQFQGFQQAQAARGVVNQLRTSLAGGEAPLTASQAAQMTQVMAQTQPAPGAAGIGGPNPTSLVTDQTIAQAQGVLSAPQIQALQQIQQQQQSQIRLRQIMLKSPPAN